MTDAANDNATTPTVTKKGGVIEHRNLKRKDRKRHGHVYTGEVKVGQHADVTPGKSVRLHGVNTNKWEPKPHDITFKVGDRAVYGSYNLTYTGTITSIAAKTVTVTEDYSNGRKHRMSLFDFNFYNDDFDIERIRQENAVTMQHI